MRETAINFPTSLSAEEKRLKEMYEKLKNIRKAIAVATRGNANSMGGDASKAERKNTKRSMQEAEEATEEVKRKVMSGAINLKKANEKSTFKRSKVLEKRRDSDAKLKLDTSEAGNSSGNEMLSPTTPSFGSPPFSSSFDGHEHPRVNRGPTLYIRGYDLVSDSLHKAFEKYGRITRLFVEERQKSAFITFSTTEQAESAIHEMDGNMVNGITLRVSFARRQNQNGPPPGRGPFCRRPSRTSTDRSPIDQDGFKSPNSTQIPSMIPPSQPIPPAQLAWSQATSRKRPNSESNTAVNPRHRNDSRTLVSYADEDEFA